MHSNTSSSPDLPLAGLNVVELHAIGPVPFAGMLLRNLGARVTRVSPPVDPGLGVPGKARFDPLNDGKTVLLADMKTEAGMAQTRICCSRASVRACSSASGWRRPT